MNTNPASKGIKTTEFYVTVLGMVLTFLAIHGVIAFSQVNVALNAFEQIYGGAIGLLTIFGLARAYLQSRTAIKTTLINSKTNLPIANATQK